MNIKKTLKRASAAIAALGVLALAPVASAQADPVNITVTDAVMDLGTLSGVPAISSEVPDPPASLSGEVTDGVVSIPKAGFVFPPKVTEVTAGVTAEIRMEANEDMTGTYDSGTGDMSLTASLKAEVDVLGTTCVISPINLVLSTSSGKPYLGVPFESGLSGPGALSAMWTSLPPVTGGGSCGIVQQLIQGKGGIWMAQDIATPETCEDQPQPPTHPGCLSDASPPEVAPNITSGPSGAVTETSATFGFEKGVDEPQEVTGFVCSIDGGAFDPCDSGTVKYDNLTLGDHSFSVRAKNTLGEGPIATRSWTISEDVKPPDPDPAKLGGLKVKPKSKKVKRGKKVTITAKVKNVGESAATGVKICVTAPKKLVKVKKCVSKGSLGAGKTATAKFKVTVKKKAKKGKKAVLKLKATAKGLAAKKGKATIKVK